MSHPNDQHLSLKDKITSHLPGHKNQDNNANGIPDRLEKNSAATHGTGVVGGANDLNRNGIPDNLERRGVVGGANDLNRNGIPDNLERQGLAGTQTYSTTTTTTTVGGMNDLNRNGIPDNLERRGVVGGATDLNRNGIPDQLEGQTGFGFVGSVTANQTSVVDVREAPTIVERVEKAAVVHEVYKTEEVVQIQPVINREREQLDVYEVVQPIREREVVATEVREAVLPAQTRAVVVEDNSAFLAQRGAPTDFSTREVAATMSQTVTNAPIVHETITHRVIEEVQPVIYKEIDRPILVKETLPIYEKVVEAPHAHHTVLPMRDLGVRTTTTTTGFTDLNRDGIPDQLQGGMYQTTGVYQTTTVGGMNDLNRNGIPDNLERQGSYGTTTTTTTVGGMNDLNRNGIPDNLERRGMVGGMNDLNRNGIPDNLERGNMVGQPGYVQQGGLISQPQVVNQGGLLSQPQIVNQGGVMGQQGVIGQPGHRSLHDLNGNGIDDSVERKMGNTRL